MELYLREEELKFRVHLKENQLLKYSNLGSNHSGVTFKATPQGVLRRLTGLTSITPKNQNMKLDKLYPGHADDLQKANLINSNFKFPTLQESLAKIQEADTDPTQEESQPQDLAKQAKHSRDKARTTWFVIGYSKIWGLPIVKRLEKLRKKYKLTWLRNQMVYSKFNNLGQKFNSNLIGKVMEGIDDEEKMNAPYN